MFPLSRTLSVNSQWSSPSNCKAFIGEGSAKQNQIQRSFAKKSFAIAEMAFTAYPESSQLV